MRRGEGGKKMSVFVHSQGIITVHGAEGEVKNGKILSTQLLNDPLCTRNLKRQMQWVDFQVLIDLTLIAFEQHTDYFGENNHSMYNLSLEIRVSILQALPFFRFIDHPVFSVACKIKKQLTCLIFTIIIASKMIIFKH